jgi:transcription initiation factor TFIIA large subunit
MSVVGQLYRIIIDDVIKNVKAEFAAEGLDDNVLQELQQTWEMKLQQSGAVNLAMGENADYAQHTAYQYDLNTYNTNFLQTPFPDLSHNTLYTMNSQAYLPPVDMSAAPRPYSTPNTQLAATALRSLNANTFDTLGKPQQYMPAPSWNSQVNVNLNDRSGASNASIQNIIRQQDGASDQPTQEDSHATSKMEETKKVDEAIFQKYEEILKKKAEKAQKKTKSIPQLDGKSGDSDEEDDDEEAEGDEELDSDLDDDDDAEPETENFVLCQYEKVTRIKNKRKTNLKDGIMHLNGRDSVFHKATGEFDW